MKFDTSGSKSSDKAWNNLCTTLQLFTSIRVEPLYVLHILQCEQFIILSQNMLVLMQQGKVGHITRNKIAMAIENRTGFKEFAGGFENPLYLISLAAMTTTFSSCPPSSIERFANKNNWRFRNTVAKRQTKISRATTMNSSQPSLELPTQFSH